MANRVAGILNELRGDFVSSSDLEHLVDYFDDSGDEEEADTDTPFREYTHEFQ